MTALKNHPGLWLNDAAASALGRLEDAHGRISLNSAGRTEAEQQNLINRWDKGGAANRPPYLYAPARPASTSNHVKGGGLAVDTPDISKMLSVGGAFGFHQPFKSDPVHFEYDASRDPSKPGGDTGATQITRDRQNWLNASRAAGLVVDGVEGPATKQAYKDYQTFLAGSYGYTGAIDGVWGDGTQAAHAKYYTDWNTPHQPAQPATGVPAGLPWRGIQEMLKGGGYGYTGLIDDIPGTQTVSAFQTFLSRNGYQPGVNDGIWGDKTGTAAQRWLKARWGYKGAIDNDFGGGTRAAWGRAEVANAAAF